MTEEVTPLNKYYEDIIMESIIEWIDSSKPLDPKLRQEMLDRMKSLRLKFQVAMIEIEKRMFKEFALDVEMESEFRAELKRSFPYLTAFDQRDTLKLLSSMNEERLKRLETQMTGWDFISTIENGLDSLTETKVPGEIKEEVKKMSPNKRAKLMTAVQEIVKGVQEAEKAETIEAEKLNE